MMRLRIDAHFAACRTFSAGWYRPTATFLTPSAVYGLLLNVAGLESRLTEEREEHPGGVPATVMREDLPRLRIALGAPVGNGNVPVFPTVQTMYQQLHNYPVGKDAGIPRELSKGNKNNITPVRRELLHGVRALIALEANDDFCDRIVRGLAGELNDERYGLLFVGDNNCLPDRIVAVDDSVSAAWYERIEEAHGAPRSGTTRLTVWIDRADMSKTVSHLFAPTDVQTARPPEGAWVTVPPSLD